MDEERIKDAEIFLESLLWDHEPVEKDTIYQEAREAGVYRSSLWWAREKMKNIEQTKVGEKLYWRLR